MSSFFTQHKNWIEFRFSGQRVGRYFERFSGGQVEYAVADASPANSGGHLYRATRFRIGEITIEGYLDKDTYNTLLGYFAAYHKDRNQKAQISISRTYRDGNNQKITEVYERCAIIAPAQPEDADVGRDTDFMMFSVRLQPEKKTLYVNDQKIQSWDPDDQLNDSNAYINP